MNRKYIILIIAIILLITSIGISYAFFTYDKTSTKSHSMLFGDISLTYNEEVNEIELVNSFPESKESARGRNDNYITFTIDGSNTSNRDIYYEIDLLYGDDINGKNRVEDNFIMMDLVEIDSHNNETYLIDSQSYSSIDHKRLWVDTIDSGTNSIHRTYKLRIWIGDYLVISNLDDIKDYTPEEYRNLFGNIKVNVNGDFNERKRTIDDSCFETREMLLLNTNMTQDEINTCANYLIDSWDIPPEEENGIIDYCRGVETDKGSFQEALNYEEFQYEDIIFFKNNNIIYVDNMMITGYDISCGTDVVIPNYINGSPVSSIGANAFSSVTTQLEAFYVVSYDGIGITSVVIPDTVTTIDSGAFGGNYLTQIVLPSSLEYIGEGAFANNRIRRVDIPNGITTLQGFELNRISHIDIPSNITIIGPRAFSNNLLSQTINIPSSVTEIQYGAFAYNRIENVNLQSNLEVLEDRCFDDNLISNIVIPNTVTYLSGFGHNYLSSLNIPSSVSVIGYDAFEHNHLESLTIPANVLEIKDHAFDYNYLESLVIPNTVTSIGSGAFTSNKLTSVNIGSGINVIDSYVFSDNKLKNLVIPDSVTKIGLQAFAYNMIENASIGNGLTYVGSSAFRRAFKKDDGSNNGKASVHINMSCSAIRNISCSSGGESNCFPWLDFNRPYYTGNDNVIFYGINNEVCGSY